MHLKYCSLEEEIGRKWDRLFGQKDCLIEVKPGNVLLPPKYKEIGERIRDLEVRPDDIWLVSYPRTGSTWTQEMVWCICNGVESEATKTASLYRTPLLELTAVLGNEKGKWKEALGNSVDLVEGLPSPRFIKTHLPGPLLPRQLDEVKPKIIYVSRNPKDMCVSYYHYCRLLHDLEGPFEDFCDLFLQGKAPVGPIWEHILGFWEKKNQPNVLFLKFEDMKKDQRGCILKTGSFLGKELNEEEVDRLMEHLKFDKMRENPALNLDPLLKLKYGENFKQKGNDRFFRKGTIGDWKNYMDQTLSDKFDNWMRENLAGTGLTFNTN